MKTTTHNYTEYRQAILNAKSAEQVEQLVRYAEADAKISLWYLDKLKSLASQRKRQITYEGYCWRRSCIYWKEPGKYGGNSCDYMQITGHSKIAQIPDKKLRRDYRHCPVYDNRKPAPKERIPSERAQSKYDWSKGRELYNGGATDREIAEALGCSREAVKWWRRRNRLTVNAEKDRQNETL